jgi:parvulin-like peptidyl-prolyl isomerase
MKKTPASTCRRVPSPHGLFILALAIATTISATEAPPATSGGLENLPVTVAEADGRPITRNALLRELVGSAGPAALDRLVRRMVINQAAKMSGISVSDEECRRQALLDAQALESELIRAPWLLHKPTPEEIIHVRLGLEWDEYVRTVVRDRLLARRCVARDIEPSEEELRAFFRKYPDMFQPPDRYRAAHILCTPLAPTDLWRSGSLQSVTANAERQRTELERWRRTYGINIREERLDLADEPDIVREAWEKSRLQAVEALRELRAGRVSWEQAVAKWSQDPQDQWSRDPQGKPRPPQRKRLNLLPGEVGWFTKFGPFYPQFADAAIKLRPEEFSEPVRTPYGWHVIRLLEVAPSAKVGYEQAAAKVRETFLENEIQLRSDAWLDELVRAAVLQTTRNLLWPPAPGKEPTPTPTDPVVGTVNGEPLRRSVVWKELLRAEGADALDRLINRELILGPLRRWGPERLEWYGAPAALRARTPPPERPLPITEIDVDLALNSDRLTYDALRETAVQNAPATFAEYLFQHYGQSEEEYRRALEAGLALKAAVARVADMDEPTLRVQYALTAERRRRPTLFEVSRILLAPESGMARASEAERLRTVLLARKIAAEYARAPETFGALAAEYSQASRADKHRGGRMGWLTPEGSPPDETLDSDPLTNAAERRYRAKLYLEIVAQDLKSGELSSPIPTERGWELIRVDQRREGGPIPEFETVRDQIAAEYMAAKAKICSDLWLRTLPTLTSIRRHVFPKTVLDVPPDRPLAPVE